MSKKVKYYYDPESLAYRIISPKKRKKFGYALLFLIASALFGFLCFVILMNTPYFETPKDRIQAREIENMKLSYAILNKKIEDIDQVATDLEDRDNKLYRVYFNSAPSSKETRRGIIDR